LWRADAKSTLVANFEAGKKQADITDYVGMVDPYIMSARGRWFFFGSGKRPFGMVNLFPDTKNAGQNGGGYNYRFNEVLGFCHLHGWMTVGLDQNTLLIFASDNGPGPFAVKETEASGHRAAGVLRGSKALAYEGGHRIPFIAKWPERIKSPCVTQSVINFTDVFATLAELLNVDVEKTYPVVTRDSYSFLSSLLQSGKRFARPTMVNTPDCMRIGDWKLIAKKRLRGPGEKNLSGFDLYNLADDISEKRDLSPENPERTKRLFDEYRAFIAERRLK